jgi:hypothetical protein
MKAAPAKIGQKPLVRRRMRILDKKPSRRSGSRASVNVLSNET